MRAVYRSLQLGLLAVAGIAFSATAQAPSELRVALVIGNASYPVAPLSNPANDARAMSGVLETMGFTVIETRDADKAQMQAALGRASDMLKGRNGVGLLYYAGHGLQLDWRNYMVPVDAKLENAADVVAQAIDVQDVLNAFRAAGNRTNIVVLDACRDNPFGAVASARGLAPMDAPSGTLLAYATAPGNVAEDGDATSGNGLYTRYLVRELKVPDAKIEDVFKRVRLQVRRRSEGRQVPWESTSLEDDFYFDAKSQHRGQEGWEKAFAVQKPDWDRIKESKNREDFYSFLQKYPSGLMAEQAQFRLDQLDKPQLHSELATAPDQRLSSGEPRFRVGDKISYRRSDLFSGAGRADLNLVVTFAGEDRVELNGGGRVLDPMGNLVTDSEGTRRPAKVRIPSDLSLGKRWQTAYKFYGRGGKAATDLIWSYRVTALEEISTPAGVHAAFRVEGTSTSTSGYRQTERYWIDPKTFLIVRDEHAEYAPDGCLNTSTRSELASYQASPAR